MIFRALAREVREADWSGFLPTPTDGSIPAPGEITLTDSGIPVTEGTAMRLSGVYGCSSLITNAIATMPKDVFHKERREDRLVPVEDDPPPLVTDPHPEMDPVDWWSRLIMSLLLRGNGYGLITGFNELAWPTEILPLHPDTCRPQRERGIGEIRYTIPGFREPQLAWPRGPVWHVRGVTLPGAIEGLSVLECARQGVGLGLAAEQFGARFFDDQAIPSGVLKVSEKIADDERGRTRAKAIIAHWRRTHGRRRTPALLTDGAEWDSISVNPNEAQFLETRKFQLADIARFFNMAGALHLLDPTAATAWGSGIEQLGLGFRIYTCGSWIVRCEQAFRRLLPGDQYLRFNVNGLERGDFKSRHDGYAQAIGWMTMTPNEARALEEREPMEGGDELLLPTTHRLASDAPLSERAQAAAVLIRAGADFDSTVKAFGLPSSIQWSKRLPVTVQLEDDPPESDASPPTPSLQGGDEEGNPA